ncbi:hypothetical protein D3C86_2087430 [compost metagenome]
MLACQRCEFIQIDRYQLWVIAVIDLRSFGNALQVVIHLPEFGHQRMICPNRPLPFHRHGRQRLVSHRHLVFIERAK